MTFTLSIPRPNNAEFATDLNAGEIMFVLGANGTGKSSLLQTLFVRHRPAARRIAAHRQTWFESSGVTMSSAQRKDTVTNMLNQDAQPNSRWTDPYASHRANVAIFDLVDAENVRARRIAGAVDARELDLAQELSKSDAPIKIINELMRLSNLPIEISVDEADQVMARRSGGEKYGISQLSDGERNALLIATDVLTAPLGTLLLIDEPERHLHRSIISPLLTLLFRRREDCSFVVSTHDVMLPLDNPSAKVLLVRNCIYQQATAVRWEVDLLDDGSEIDEVVRRDILGGRRKLLFAEGTETSLDKPLYSLIFPGVSVIPKSSCRDVEHTVSSIRDAANLHWIRAFGVVDNDRRPQADIAALEAKGVYAVPVFAVESIYFHTQIMWRLAERQKELTGADPAAAMRQATANAMEAIRPHIIRLCERVVETTVRKELMKKLPKRADIAAAQPFNVAIDVPQIYNEEVARLGSLYDDADLTSIVARYPVRETPALDRISASLGFRDRKQYESAVLKLLKTDGDALNFVRSLFGSLFVEIAAN